MMKVRSTSHAALAAEIDCIVASPYPTQLKQLHTIICQNCSDTEIILWTASKPCQVPALASNILEALQQWPYVLEIITRLCVVPSMRDALLQQYPTLLFEVVSQAVTGSWQHNAAAIAMLSHPLPPNVAVPAASQTLFLGIVDHAVASPSSASIKPVYQLMKGGLAPLLGLLSHDTLTQMERHFHDILRSTICQTDECLTLYCLAVMKIMVRAAEDELSCTPGSFYETQELLASTPNTPRWKPTELQRYFSGSKVNRALHLIVLRVIGATKVVEDGSVTQPDGVLSLATEIVDYLPVDVRDKWCNDNPILVRKLWEKASQPALHKQMQLQAIVFNATLCVSQALPGEQSDSVARLLADPANLAFAVPFASASVITRFAQRASSNHVSDIVSGWSSFAATGEDIELVTHAGTVSENLAALVDILSGSDVVNSGVVAALSSAAVGEHLTQILSHLRNSSTQACQPGAALCTRSVRQARATVAQTLGGLFLCAALSSDHSQTDVASDLYPLLVQLHAISAKQDTVCQHQVTRAKVPSMGLQYQTTLEMPCDVDWRTSVQQHLEAKAKSEHSDLSRIFVSACADIEQRCTEVEAPLRAERARVAELQQQYADLMDSLEAMQDEKRRAESNAIAADAERAAFAREVDEAKLENDSLTLRIDELRASLEASQRAAREQLEKAKEAAELAEISHAAVIAQQHERFDDLQVQVAKLEGDASKRLAHESRLKHDLEVALREANDSQAVIARHESTNEELTQRVLSLEQAKLDADGRCASLQVELRTLQDEILVQRSKHETDCQEAQQQADQRIVKAQEEHEARIATIQAEHQEQVRGLALQISTLQDESHQAQHESATQLAKRDRRLASNAKKIDDLKQLCATKDDQLAEAHAMRSNLMAAMGLGDTRTQGTQARRVTRSAAIMQASCDSTDASIDLGVNSQPTPDVTEISTRHASPEAKSAKNCRTPGLPRGSTAAKTASRPPLVAISTNRTPSKMPRLKTPGTKLREFSVALDDTTFDGSEVFASTLGLKKTRDELPVDESEMQE